jgi:hypothetical protein
LDFGLRESVRADEMLSAFLELQKGDTRVRDAFDFIVRIFCNITRLELSQTSRGFHCFS